MAEALSTVFNFPSNQGAATIIRDAGPGFLDVLSKTALTQRALKAKQADDAGKAFKGVKLKESWRMFSPAIEKQYTDLLGRTSSRIQAGNFSQAELSADIGKLNRMAESSMQLKGEVEKIDAEYTKNKFVNEGLAGEEMTKRLIGDQSTDALEKAALGTVEKDFFLQEMGGSKYLNENQVINTLLKESLPDWQTTKIKEMGDFGAISRGLLESRGTESSTKLKSFLREDENGNIKVVNPEALRDNGISEMFLSNPYASRIVRDNAMKLAKADGRKEYSDEDIDKSVYGLLKGREAGETSRKDVVQTARSYVDSGADIANSIGKFLAGKLESMERGDLTVDVPIPGPVRPGERPLVMEGAEDDIFLGWKKGDTRLGKVRKDPQTNELVVSVTERVFDEGEYVERTRETPVTFGLIETFRTPREAHAVWKELKKKGLVDPAGRVRSSRTLMEIGKGSSKDKGFTGFKTTE